VRAEFPPDVSTYWFHHRCYRGKATDNYLLMARTGTEFIDLEEQRWDINHWVRGACLYGVMPANGLLYAPQHPCACYLEAKMSGFSALGPAGQSWSDLLTESEPPGEPARLLRGPAYGATGDAAGASSAAQGASTEDWPTYRHDASRSGHARTSVPTKLDVAWEAEIGGRLSSPVIANGTVCVAAVDTHTVHAVDASTGEPRWQFAADKLPPPASRSADARPGESEFLVQHHWTKDLPLLPRGLVLADGVLFLAGPEDLIDEEQTMRQINTPAAREQLVAQAAAFAGQSGGLLSAVSASNGQQLGELSLESPPVFDGLAAAGKRLYLSTMAGQIVCLAGAP
jgi:hypothetical protein